MICISIVAQTSGEAHFRLEEAERIADVIELRLDLLPCEVWRDLLRKEGKPRIVTLRPLRQGGRFAKTEEERVRFLEEMLAFRPAYLDLEWDTPSHLVCKLIRKKREKTRIITSYHHLENTPVDLEEIWKKVSGVGGDLVKIVTLARTLSDNVRILELVRSHPGRTIGFCMGTIGLPSRILTLRFGGLLTYGSLAAGAESAPGQIPALDLKVLYRVKEISPNTSIYGLLGNPVSHALSPLIHNTAFQALGCDAVYIPFESPDLERLVPSLQSIGVQGLSVTIPHKEAVIPLLHDVDEKARSMGAVNTIYWNGQRWAGTNTDYFGAWGAIEESGARVRSRRWAILGTGGAARAVAFGAGRFGDPKSLTFVGRTPGRVDSIVKDIGRLFNFSVTGLTFPKAEFGGAMDRADIIVNCTPVGMAPGVDRVPISAGLLARDRIVFDTVYNPMETALLREARLRGCRTVSGLRMLLLQGAAQFELWTGEKAPVSLMEQMAIERLSR
jgi:3-dehydroquinate dehydratase / shikimate dehydrogenase